MRGFWIKERVQTTCFSDIGTYDNGMYSQTPTQWTSYSRLVHFREATCLTHVFNIEAIVSVNQVSCWDYIETLLAPFDIISITVKTSYVSLGFDQGCDRYKYFGSPNLIKNQIRLVLLVLTDTNIRYHWGEMAKFVSPNQIQIQIGLVLLVRPNTPDDTSQPCMAVKDVERQRI